MKRAITTLVLVLVLTAYVMCYTMTANEKFNMITSLTLRKNINELTGHNPLSINSLRKAFELMDSNLDSYIDAREIEGAKICASVSKDDTTDIIREGDIDGDGRFDWEEFLKISIIKY